MHCIMKWCFGSSPQQLYPQYEHSPFRVGILCKTLCVQSVVAGLDSTSLDGFSSMCGPWERARKAGMSSSCLNSYGEVSLMYSFSRARYLLKRSMGRLRATSIRGIGMPQHLGTAVALTSARILMKLAIQPLQSWCLQGSLTEFSRLVVPSQLRQVSVMSDVLIS